MAAATGGAGIWRRVASELARGDLVMAASVRATTRAGIMHQLVSLSESFFAKMSEAASRKTRLPRRPTPCIASSSSACVFVCTLFILVLLYVEYRP